ncbi:NUDIX domain-containing protein [Corynebacterium sp. zg254]|uniref:NUDIX hydrolase n=1 Tax=Corynebacterium zhongnanshanii TaxID=2768834 RepID=A0ABQ6VGK5_9CORY|nr:MULTISPECIES: NUDIX hydrolase [Corynebacterium]KAB3523567.1 NUDIX hydrolase [Corynebacterium zhongnanshanii]MCR5913270.1 NUDIX domain-containing protein [Corynebacterium sp. zg254]
MTSDSQPHSDSQPLYEVKESELLVDAPIIALRRDTISTATGDAVREVVEHFGAVAVVAVKDGCVQLIRQYRHAVGEYLWELPAGILDKVGENPLVAAQRELAEEAQLKAESWHLLGDVVTSPGFAEERVRIFLAEDVSELSEQDQDELGLETQTGEEADLDVCWLPVEEAVQWVQEGKIINSIAVAGIAHLALGTRRSTNEPFTHVSGLKNRRENSEGVEPGTDMKSVR